MAALQRKIYGFFQKKNLGAQQQHPLQSLFFRIAIELILTVGR